MFFCAKIILGFYKHTTYLEYVVLTFDIIGEVLTMKKTLSLVFAFALVLAVMLGLASCGKDIEFNVNFVVDGEVYATVGTSGNESIRIPENPSKDGYTFDGWYWDNGVWQKPFTANSLLDAPLSSDMSVYAKWNCSHSSSDWIIDKEATCNQAGSKHKECTKCEEVLETEVIDKLTTHTPAEAVTENFVDSTCKVEGSYDEVIYCSVCDIEISRTEKTVAKKTTHTPGETKTENFVDSTCKVEGSYDEVVYCSICGVEISRTEKTVAKKTTHTPGETKTENFVDSTCKVEGSYDEVVYCSICGVEISRTEKTVAKKTTHTPGETKTENFVDSTCKVEGSYDEVVYCSVCDVEISRTEKAVAKKTTHTPGEAKTENFVDSTCKAEGSYDEVVYCSICGKRLSTEIKTVEKKEHTDVVDKAVAPTCTETGLTAGKHCSVCNEVLVAQTVIPANGHSYGEWEIIKYPTESTSGEKRRDCANCNSFELGVVAPLSHDHTRWETTTLKAVAPTCTETGLTEGKKCSGCGEILISQNVVSALGHTEVTDKAVAPTCTKTGLTEGKHCSVCNATLVAQNTVSALGHTEVTDKAVAPTCTTTGLTEGKHCSVCDGILVAQTIVPAKGHSYGEWYVTKQPTESASGEKRRDCANCSVFETATVAPLSHDHSRWETTTLKAVAPTCTETGLTEGKKCSGCGEILVAQNSVDALGHKYNSVVTAPTCTEKGYTTHTCHCGDTYVDTYVDELGHAYNSGVITTAPTCTEKGVKTFTCGTCQDSYTEEVAALGHSEGETVVENNVAPNCTNKGSYDNVVYCLVCDAELSRNTVTVDALGHSHTSNTTAPTCTDRGYTTHTCHCGDIYVDTYVDELGHAYNDGVITTAPTCTEKGVKTFTCGTCQDSYTEEVAALGHTEGEIVVENNVDPDCVNDGSYDNVVYCTVCEAELSRKTETVDALGHSHNSVVTAPTCTEKGYTTHTCHCGDAYIDTYVDALGHTYNDGVITTAPTCTEKGVKTFTCGTCQDSYTEEVAALGHTEGEIVVENNVAPDCVNDGSYDNVVYCTVCDVELSRNTVTIDALGHSYTSAITAPTCTEKGYTTHTCNCGDSYVDTYVDAKGHTEVNDEAVPSTCTATGLTAGSHCSGCGKIFVAQEATPKLGHIEHNYAGKEATCLEPGWSDYFVCERAGCGYSSYEEIAPLGHDEINHAEVPATCQRVGASAYVTCSRCDYHTDSVELPIVDHLFQNYLLDDPDHYYCLNTYHRTAYCEYGCGEKSEMAGEKGNHRVTLYTLAFVKPTATSTGYFDFRLYCEICDEIFDERRVTISQPSGNSGSNTGKWYNNPLLSDVPYPDNFTVSSLVLDKTSDVSLDSSYYGYAGGYFKANSTAQIQNYIAKLKQSKFSYNVSQTNASYTGYNSTGSLKLVVGFVGTDLTIMVYKVKDVNIGSGSATDHIHNYKNYTIAPTCTEQGFIVNYCYCGAVIWDYIDPESTHANCTIYPTVKPTCTENGLTQGRYCNDCNKTVVEQKDIPALGHNDENGYCSRCSELTVYTITFVAEGKIVNTINYTVETQSINKPAIPEKFGHTGKWAEFELGTSDMTVEAVYTPNTYSITYVLNNGVNNESNPSAYTFGDIITLGAPTIKEPFVIFGGWFTDPAFTEQYAITEINASHAEDITLYAQWIYYRIESAEGFEIDYSGDMPTLRIRIPSASKNFDFKNKIKASPNCVWRVYGDEYSSIEYALRLVPVSAGDNVYYIIVFHPDQMHYTQYRVEIYRRESYTYEYLDFNGNVIASGNYDEDSELPTTEPPVYDGFTFVGWSVGNEIVDYPTVPDRNISLSPVYSAKYKVEYYLENLDKTDYELIGTEELSGLTNKVMVAEVLEIPHFTFNTEDSIINGSFSLTEELVLVVRYTRNTYKITATTKNGTVTCAGEHPYGSLVTLTTKAYPGFALSALSVAGEDVLDYIDYQIFIDADVHIVAEFYDIAPEMENFEFTSSATTCTISGIKDKTVTEIIVPEYVTSIAQGAFSGCSNLESITLPFVGGSKNATKASSSTLFGYIFGTLNYSDGVSTKQYYSSDYSVTYYIPSSLRDVTITGGNILYGAFYNCTNLTSVTIGNSVTSIGNSAFSGCTSLTRVYITDIAAWCNISFGNASANPLYYTENLYLNGELVIELVVPDSVTNIGDYAFYYCTSLTSIVIPDSVTSIGSYAFRNCTSLTSVTIPDSVTSIGNYAFYNCTALEEIYFNATAMNDLSSSNYVFYNAGKNCNGIKVVIGKNVTKIPADLFYPCSDSIYSPKIISVEFEEGSVCESIGSSVFRDCTGLTSITIPDSVTSIGSSAFENCYSFTSITIPDSVTSIGNYAFYGCTGLTSIIIPDSVTSIGDAAFRNCTSLTSVNITDLTAWCNIDFYSYDSNPLYYAGNLYLNGELVTELVIPDGVNEIKKHAFRDFDSLTSVVIPDSVTSIGNYAFYNCTSLTSVTIPDSVTSIGTSAFYNCTSLTSVTIPDSVTSIGSSAFYGCSTLESIKIPFVGASSTATGYMSHFGYIFGYSRSSSYSSRDHYVDGGYYYTYHIPSRLKTVIIGDNVTTIRYSTFYNCKSLTSVTIGNSVTSIGSSAFSGCTSLTSVTIGNSVTSIGDYAFYNCTGIEEIYFNATAMNDLSSSDEVFSYAGQNGDGIKVVIGKNVTKIPAYLFYPYSSSYAPKVVSVEFEEGSICESIGSSAFAYCTSLTSVTIPNSVTSIGSSAFSSCNNLTSIVIPDSVTSIGNSAFYKCTGIEEIYFNAIAMNDLRSDNNYVFYNAGKNGNGIKVVIGANVTKIPAYLFYPYSSSSSYAPKIASVEFEEGSVCKSIGNSAFYYCTSLTSVTFGNNVTSIGYYAFYNCTSLTSITIPDSVTSIGDYAFDNCTSLTSVTIPNSITSIGKYAFYNCTSLTSIIIPDSVTSIGNYAFKNCNSLTSVTIPDSVTSIGDEAFSYCYSLEEIYFNATAMNDLSSSDYVFDDAGKNGNGIKVVIGKNVTKIPAYLFYPYSSNSSYAPKIVSVEFEEGSVCASIGSYAFYNCDSLTSVTIGNSVTSIGSSAFSGCSGLTSIIIPDSVTSIGSSAFYGCTGLTIYCEAASKPSGWNSSWNYSKRPVVWGYKG